MSATAFSLANNGAGSLVLTRGGATAATYATATVEVSASPRDAYTVFFGPALTTVDWRDCTSPTAASRAAWITAVTTLARPPDTTLGGSLSVGGDLSVTGGTTLSTLASTTSSLGAASASSLTSTSATIGTLTVSTAMSGVAELLFGLGLGGLEIASHTVIASVGSISATLHDMSNVSWTISIPAAPTGCSYWVECLGSLDGAQGGGSSSTQTFVAKVTTPDTSTTVLRDCRNQIVDTVAGNDSESMNMAFVYQVTQTGSHTFFWAAYGTWAPFGVDANRCVLPYRLYLRKNSVTTSSTSAVS